MTYQVIINNEVCFIAFDKKECTINASPYLMFLMGRPRSEVESVFAKRGWTWTVSS